MVMMGGIVDAACSKEGGGLTCKSELCGRKRSDHVRAFKEEKREYWCNRESWIAGGSIGGGGSFLETLRKGNRTLCKLRAHLGNENCVRTKVDFGMLVVVISFVVVIQAIFHTL